MGTSQETARLEGEATGWGIHVGCLLRWAVCAGTCLIVLLVLPESISTVYAPEPVYMRIGMNGTIRLADTMSDVPGERHMTLRQSRGRYHAAVSDQELEDAVTRYAKEYRLSPALLMAVMKAESGFNPTVISKAGAVGLMQLIPETAIRHGVKNLYDTRDNIAGGARHLRYLLDRFHGNVRLALAAYNAGERKVKRYRQIPPFKETRTYVNKVMGFYRDYRRSWFLGTGESVANRNMIW